MSKELQQCNSDATIRHIPKFGGELWFVSKDNGSDTNAGTAPDAAFETIGAAITACAAGDAITIMAGTYTETGLDLNKNNVELWPEIGTVIDPASGDALTISANYCKIDGHMVITPVAGSSGLKVSGTFGYFKGVTASAGDTNFEVLGQGNVFIECIGSVPSATSFDIQANSNSFISCRTAGIGTATTGYKVNNNADYVVFDRCTSIGHGTSSFHLLTGSVSCMIKDCTSGVGDGRWNDVDHLSEWSNFQFAGDVSKEIDITQGGANTYQYNLFKVTGTVKINSIIGIVETVLVGSNTDCYLDVYSTNGQTDLSKDTTLTLGTALVGATVARLDKADKVLTFADADAPGLLDEIDTKKEGFRLVEDRTGAAHVATYIRFIHTTDGASSGEIDWYVDWEPVSDDGFLAAV